MFLLLGDTSPIIAGVLPAPASGSQGPLGLALSMQYVL